MAVVRLAIDSELCGPISIGTVAVVRLLHEHLGLSIDAATACVDRCVFDTETLHLELPSREAAERLVRALTALPSATRISARVESERAEQSG